MKKRFITSFSISLLVSLLFLSLSVFYNFFGPTISDPIILKSLAFVYTPIYIMLLLVMIFFSNGTDTLHAPFSYIALFSIYILYFIGVFVLSYFVLSWIFSYKTSRKNSI